MGYFTRLGTGIIRPRELFDPKRERRLFYIWSLIDCHLNGNGDYIVPPAVKKSESGEWWTVDGHTRLLVADLFRGESEVYVPSNKDDGFTEDILPGASDFMIKDLNYTIRECFDAADRVNYLSDGVKFSDIRQLEGFSFLGDADSAKRFYDEWRPKVEAQKQRKRC